MVAFFVPGNVCDFNNCTYMWCSVMSPSRAHACYLLYQVHVQNSVCLCIHICVASCLSTAAHVFIASVPDTYCFCIMMHKCGACY